MTIVLEKKERIEGMYNHNIKLMAQNNDDTSMMRERKLKMEDKLRKCSSCKIFLSSATFYKHWSLSKDTADSLKIITIMDSNRIQKDQDLIRGVLSKYQDDDTENLCRTDFVKLWR